MPTLLEKSIIEQCAPTLAGLKVGNMFLYRYDKTSDTQTIYEEIAHYSHIFSHYGLNIRILKECSRKHTFLIYIYRVKRIYSMLENMANRTLLIENGYRFNLDIQNNHHYSMNTRLLVDDILQQLSDKICFMDEFPHEIGLFLGYPYEDVIGFIENKGKNYTYCGYWKTYGDPEISKKKFQQFQKCVFEYKRMYEKGKVIKQLIVAA